MRIVGVGLVLAMACGCGGDAVVRGVIVDGQSQPRADVDVTCAISADGQSATQVITKTNSDGEYRCPLPDTKAALSFRITATDGSRTLVATADGAPETAAELPTLTMWDLALQADVEGSDVEMTWTGAPAGVPASSYTYRIDEPNSGAVIATGTLSGTSVTLSKHLFEDWPLRTTATATIRYPEDTDTAQPATTARLEVDDVELAIAGTTAQSRGTACTWDYRLGLRDEQLQQAAGSCVATDGALEQIDICAQCGADNIVTAVTIDLGELSDVDAVVVRSPSAHNFLDIETSTNGTQFSGDTVAYDSALDAYVWTPESTMNVRYVRVSDDSQFEPPAEISVF